MLLINYTSKVEAHIHNFSDVVNEASDIDAELCVIENADEWFRLRELSAVFPIGVERFLHPYPPFDNPRVIAALGKRYGYTPVVLSNKCEDVIQAEKAKAAVERYLSTSS